MKISQHPAAVIEIDDALAWYAERNPRVAQRLWEALLEARLHISTFPRAATGMRRDSYRFVVQGFPYDLIYRLNEHEILVIAFAHHSRRPGYWKTRLESLI